MNGLYIPLVYVSESSFLWPSCVGLLFMRTLRHPVGTLPTSTRLVVTAARRSISESALERQLSVALSTSRTHAVQGRLRRVFSSHLSIVVEWHTKVLREAMAALLERDEASGWRPAAARGAGGGDRGGGAGRLDSARALILESRSQADNSLPVLRQSSTSVAAFSEAITGVLTVRALSAAHSFAAALSFVNIVGSCCAAAVERRPLDCATLYVWGMMQQVHCIWSTLQRSLTVNARA